MESENLPVAEATESSAGEDHLESIPEGGSQALPIVDEEETAEYPACCICQDDAPLVLPGEGADNEGGTDLGHVCEECHALARAVCTEPPVDGVTKANMRLVRELRRQGARIVPVPEDLELSDTLQKAFEEMGGLHQTAMGVDTSAPEITSVSIPVVENGRVEELVVPIPEVDLAAPPFMADIDVPAAAVPEIPQPEVPVAARERTIEESLREQLGVGGTVEITDNGVRVKTAGVLRFGHGPTIHRALFDLRCPGQLPGAEDNVVTRNG